MALSDAHLQQFLAQQRAEMPREQVLYEFNAGCMSYNPSSRLVTADSRRGRILLTMEDDNILRFQWRLRNAESNNEDPPLFIFPRGATFTKINECPDGTVFLLKMKDSSVRKFYWLQEALPTSKDGKNGGKTYQAIIKRVQQLIDNPPKWGDAIPAEEEVTTAAADESEAMTDIPSVTTESRSAGPGVLVHGTGHATATPVAEAQRGAVLHPPAAAAATAAPAATSAAATSTAATGAPASGASSGAASSTGAINANSLVSTLNSMAQALAARQQERAGVEDVLDADRVQQILDVDSALVNALIEYLPEGQRDPASLRETLRSPQLQQTMSRLSQILNSSQFGHVMASLSLPVGASTGIGVDGFIAAIQAQANKQQQEKGNSSGSSSEKK